MNKELVKAAWVRAYRSFLQALITQIPAGFVVTPAMIQYFKISYIYVILAIIANASLYGLAAFITGIVGGLPEVSLKNTLYALDNDPNDDDEVEDESDECEEGDI